MATVASGTTNAQGQVNLIVPPGTVTLAVNPPAGYTAPGPQTVVATAGQTLTVKFQLTAPEATLTVDCVDQFGNPVANAALTATE